MLRGHRFGLSAAAAAAAAQWRHPSRTPFGPVFCGLFIINAALLLPPIQLVAMNEFRLRVSSRGQDNARDGHQANGATESNQANNNSAALEQEVARRARFDLDFIDRERARAGPHRRHLFEWAGGRSSARCREQVSRPLTRSFTSSSLRRVVTDTQSLGEARNSSSARRSIRGEQKSAAKC